MGLGNAPELHVRTIILLQGLAESAALQQTALTHKQTLRFLNREPGAGAWQASWPNFGPPAIDPLAGAVVRRRRSQALGRNASERPTFQLPHDPEDDLPWQWEGQQRRPMPARSPAARPRFLPLCRWRCHTEIVFHSLLLKVRTLHMLIIAEAVIGRINEVVDALKSLVASTSRALRDFWGFLARVLVANVEDRTRHARERHTDPIGTCGGLAAFVFAAYCIYRNKSSAGRIISLFEANTQIKDLAEKAARGEALPKIVVIRGTILADGKDVLPASPGIDRLRERVGVIEQPKNAWVEIARMAKEDPSFRGVADAVAARAGVPAEDVPEVPDPGDVYKRHSDTTGNEAYVLCEILVARLCAKHQTIRQDRSTGEVSTRRPCRNASYNCFHGRRVSEGLHVLGLDGTRAELELPLAGILDVRHGAQEPPPLFLPVDDVWKEFAHNVRKEGVTRAGGAHQRLDDLPPIRLSDPSTLLSDFIFIDVQSEGDLGDVQSTTGESPTPGGAILRSIAQHYASDQEASFLWEPRGFYDSVRGRGYDELPTYANTMYRRTEMVSASDLTERAQAAARENCRGTPHCEPSFTRMQLAERRDQENCFRYIELAIPRAAPVTILARPVVVEAGTGEGADVRIRLVSPVDAEEEEEEPKSDRFRFRIMHGHTMENLLRPKEGNVTAYCGLALAGLVFAGWAAFGYPGVRPANF